VVVDIAEKLKEVRLRSYGHVIKREEGKAGHRHCGMKIKENQ
jgi:hypothetical protein